MRPESVQNKFLGFFKTDATSEQFFKQCHEYINVHKDKLSKDTLIHFYAKHKYTDELSDTCYLVDKNLEKQVVSLFKNLCSMANSELQNFVRDQSTNSKSYNMVVVFSDYIASFLNHLHFPVAYDTFQRTLECLLEMIQGPNFANQNILIQRDFVEVANAILKIDYHSTEIVEEFVSRCFKYNKI